MAVINVIVLIIPLEGRAPQYLDNIHNVGLGTGLVSL